MPSGNRVEIRPADVSAPSARRPECAPLCVEQIEECLVAALVEHDRIAEFMAADRAARGADRTGGSQNSAAVAERQPAPGEAGRMTEQSDHGVTGTGGVFQPRTEHHVAAAF